VKSEVEFLTSAARPEQFPAGTLPEVAFLGRSNVGKSSLINKLVGHPGLAKTSSTPGCTQLINFFRVDGWFHLVDLPGYGYAKVAKSESRKWRALIESYLLYRNTLRLSILLLDSRRGWMEPDRELRSWLEHRQLPYLVAATKTDKLNQKEEYHQMAAIRGEIQSGQPAPEGEADLSPTTLPSESSSFRSAFVPVSVHTGRGVRELWQTITTTLKQ
jgi:GTP-binding protein